MICHFGRRLLGKRFYWNHDKPQDVFYYGNIKSTFLLIEIRSIWLGFFGAFVLWVNATQVSTDWNNFRKNLHDFLQSRWVLFLQIEPLEDLDNADVFIKTKSPYKKFLTPFTRYIDLRAPEDDIFAQMHEKGRYNIKYAIKKWVSIEYASPTSENIDIWKELFDDTLSRDNFSWNSREYYQIFIEKIVSKNLGWLYFARYEWRVIAAGIFVFMPDRAIYYYGASSSNVLDRKVFAPYLLQWEMMKIAKQKWIAIYDLLGVAHPDDPNDTLAWVSFFKSRFGGEIVQLPQKILYPISWKYRYFYALQVLKNLLKRR